MSASLRFSSPLLVALSASLLFACGSEASDPATADPVGHEDKAGGASPSPAPTSRSTSDDELPLAPFCDASELPGTEGGANTWDNVTKKRLEALAPNPRAEYLSLRRNVGTLPSPGLTKELEVVAERGQLCAGASDVDACKKAYAALSPPISYAEHLCYTRGDQVACVETKADAMTLLGEVHNIEEAFVVASYEGYQGTCSADVTARAAALADGSFQIAAMKGGDCGPVYRAVVNVAKNGTLREVTAERVRDASPCP